jgi:hypothetical protein
MYPQPLHCQKLPLPPAKHNSHNSTSLHGHHHHFIPSFTYPQNDWGSFLFLFISFCSCDYRHVPPGLTSPLLLLSLSIRVCLRRFGTVFHSYSKCSVVIWLHWETGLISLLCLSSILLASLVSSHYTVSLLLKCKLQDKSFKNYKAFPV